MTTNKPTSSAEHLDVMLDADRALRKARESFLASGESSALVETLRNKIDVCMAVPVTSDDALDASARLIRMADLLAEIHGPESTKQLLKILGSDEPAVRVAAGEAIIDLMFDRYGEVARVIEGEIDKNALSSVALSEIPFLFAEVGEAGGTKIVVKLLKHPQAEVVGAAIESLALLGDPSVIRLLEPLKKDKRIVVMDDEENTDEEGAEGEEISIGELAESVIDHLRQQKRPS